MAEAYPRRKSDEPTLHQGSVVLASTSPRRRELLKSVGISFESMAVDIDESPKDQEKPSDLVTRLAREKVAAARKKCTSNRVIIGADTVVVIDGMTIGKPINRDHAEQVLDMLSGRVHQVFSGVALSFCKQAGTLCVKTQLNCTRVWFRDITPNERITYCRTHEPWDKSGAYAIQGMAAMFITHIEGSYTGVMGLPLFETLNLLSVAGISPLKDP